MNNFQTHVLRPAPAAMHRRQRGVSLVELMIGLAIGMLVVMAALSSVLFTRMAARSVSDSAQLEQQGTLVMNMLGQQFKQAGALNAVSKNTAAGTGAVIFDSSYTGIVDTAAGQVRVQGTDGAGTAADTLLLTYSVPNDGSMAGNCIGQGSMVYPAGGTGSDQIVNSLLVNAANRSLNCGRPGQEQPIAGNVEDMQIFYFKRLAPDYNIMRQTATEVGAAAADWAAVDAIEICLHLTGESTRAPQHTFTDCRGNLVATDADDKRVHRVIRQTFQLRNAGAV